MAFSLPHFLPYLLAQASEAASQEFQAYYRARYGMLRTEWRVLFHIGVYGELTATRICRMAGLHKTKVSRAVTALEEKRFIVKLTDQADRRAENLSLTPRGREVFEDLHAAAEKYEATLAADLSEAEVAQLRTTLLKLMEPNALLGDRAP